LVSRASSRANRWASSLLILRPIKNLSTPVMDPFPRAHSILRNAFIAKTRHPKVKIEEYAHRHHENRLGRGIPFVAISAGAQGAKALPDFPLLIPLPIRLFRYSTEGRVCFLSLW